jgi:mannosyltransferase OCH1-like enzyme
MLESINNGYKIPNLVHQTFMNKNLPIEILMIMKHNKNICAGCKFIFYDDNDCDKFIRNNFDIKIYNAFKKINPIYGAMKADFFRYCVLYKLGGIYLDIKSIINFPIFKLISKDDICVLDLPRTKYEPWRRESPTYEQWLLIFAPNHPYLLEMINKIVEYIENKYEPKIKNLVSLNTKQKILHITGPDAFTKVIKNYIEKNKNTLHRSIDYNKYFDINPTGNLYKKIYKINNRKHYSEYNEPLYI